MQPIQVTIRDIPHSLSIEEHIRKKVEKLTQFYHRINSCRVVVGLDQKHKKKGKEFKVSIDLKVPGKELVVNRKKEEDIYVAIRDAFDAIERQLEDFSHIQRGDVKRHQTYNTSI